MRGLQTVLWAGLLVAALWALAAPAGAQQILLDKPVRAGELTLFPDLSDPLVYYYVPDKPRLATDANGRPQFSFLRYVENVRTGADQAEAREGEGGGIVHAVVALSVSEDQLREAGQELQRVAPGAKIQGPVVYKSGKFGLVSSFTDTEGNLSTQVVGLGNAPLLDGEKAAVSIQLTKLGAKILWESFQTPTPDISFSFEMEMGGFHSPVKAEIEANFDLIYEHKAFAVGIASTYLAGEIKGAFDDLTREGAIKVTQVGADEKMETLLTTAYNKITEMMFAPAGGTGTPSLTSLAGGGEQPSLLDRASRMLREGREDARAENARSGRETGGATTTGGGGGGGGGGGATTTTAGGGGGGPATTTTPAGGGGGGDGGAGQQTTSTTAGGGGGSTTGTRTSLPPVSGSARPNPGGTHAETARPTDAPSTRDRPREERSEPKFAIAAAFEMKRVRQRGHFKIDLNKYTADSLTLRFDENIGDLRRLFNNAAHFRQVNLDDPLYRQREIVAFVDGLNAQDFGQYINFVSVLMRKTHAEGATTEDEVRVDRTNFNSAGNRFKMLYGWKGDADRRQWLNYEYRTIWSFFGDNTIESPWQTASAGAINLAPPYQRRIVELQADPELLSDAEVRLVTVKIHYDLAGNEQVKQVTLNPAKNQLSEKVEFMLPADQYEYSYEINWRLRGNRSVSSGLQTSSEAVLFVDELPAG